MTALFDTTPELPAGCHLLKGFLSRGKQERMVELGRELLATHPLMQPLTKSGYPLSLRVSSWGIAGWFGEAGRYYYMKKHANGKPWPPVPADIFDAMYNSLTATKFDLIKLETVLLNWYPAETGKLGRHQDVTEKNQIEPIVTISLGDTCVFNIGSPDYDDKGLDLEIQSGDVFVMGGASRLAYHGVKKVIPGTSDLLPKGGRISLTGRQVY